MEPQRITLELPPAIFISPWPNWVDYFLGIPLKGELQDMAGKYLLAEDAGVRHFFKMESVKKLWDMHQAKKRNYATAPWSLSMLEL